MPEKLSSDPIRSSRAALPLGSPAKGGTNAIQVRCISVGGVGLHRPSQTPL